jgi:AcrR family transcriptional regulator
VRVKTEARRQAMIAVAAGVFAEMGFDAASMSEISARVGGSRVTLYNYFSSKEELLLEVILASAVQKRDEAISALRASEDVAVGLRDFGTSYLKWMTSPGSLAMLRIGIAQGGHSDIGRLYYERGPQPGWAAVTDFLRTAIGNRKLRDEDPEIMTTQIKALYEAGLVEFLLLGVLGQFDEKELPRRAAVAVDVFLRAYAVKEQDSKPSGKKRKR